MKGPESTQRGFSQGVTASSPHNYEPLVGTSQTTYRHQHRLDHSLPEWPRAVELLAKLGSAATAQAQELVVAGLEHIPFRARWRAQLCRQADAQRILLRKHRTSTDQSFRRITDHSFRRITDQTSFPIPGGDYACVSQVPFLATKQQRETTSPHPQKAYAWTAEGTVTGVCLSTSDYVLWRSHITRTRKILRWDLVRKRKEKWNSRDFE